MKNLFFTFVALCLFSCSNLQNTQARKDLQANPNWESQDLWGVFTAITSKPVRGISFSLSAYSGEVILTMPIPLPEGTSLRIQFDEHTPQMINMSSETSADISSMIDQLLSAQNITLGGDLFNMGMEESVTIPVAYARQAIRAMLILSKSKKSVDEWVAALRINTSEENYPQNNWWWTTGDSAFEQYKEYTAWFRSPAQLIQDLYFFPSIAVCNRFLWENDCAILVQIRRAPRGLEIKPMFELSDANDAGTASPRQNHPQLLLRARLDKNIVQTSLKQIDKEGKVFDFSTLWPYLQNSGEMTIRWRNRNHDPLTTYIYLKGLEYRLAQIYTARHLMNDKI